MKNRRTFLFVAIILFFAFLLLAYMFFTVQSFFQNSLAFLISYALVGVIVFTCSLFCFIRYASQKKSDLIKIDDSVVADEVSSFSTSISSNFSTENQKADLDDKVEIKDEVLEFKEEDSDEGFSITETVDDNRVSTSIDVKPEVQEKKLLDFNELEESLLSQTKMESLYEIASQWLINAMPISYVAFSNVTSNNKLSIEFYNETSPSEIFLVEAVAERNQNLDDKGFLTHGGHTISVPYFRKGAIIGFVFFGSSQTTDLFTLLDSQVIGPFVRIFSTACLVIELAKAKEQRSSLQKAFSSYVPSAIVDLFEHDPSVLRVGGDYENLSIMFTDLREFTVLSESMSPDNLISVLNEYFSEMSGVIEAFGGTVSKLVGDGILAFFGGPGSDSINHAERACEAALTMKKYESILNSKLMGMGRLKTPFYTRIGISTGKVILGNIGSEKRLDYTVMGPEVNLASRIEAANKNCGTAILISYETFLLVRNVFECRRAAFIKLKGFSKSVYLFELLNKSKTVAEEKMSLANDLADLFGTDAENLLVGESHGGVASSTTTANITPSNMIDDDDIEELEEVEELEDADDIDEL